MVTAPIVRTRIIITNKTVAIVYLPITTDVERLPQRFNNFHRYT